MAELHGLLAYAALAAAVVMFLVALAGLALGPVIRLWLDRLILITLGVLLVAGLSGLPLALLTGLPGDPLHLLYGVGAPLILLAGRYLGRHGSVRRRSVFVGLATLALLGVIYRLFTTAAG